MSLFGNFIAHHQLLWFALFFLSICVLSVCGCNPLTTPDDHGEKVVKRYPLLLLPVVLAIVGEYAFFAALILNFTGLSR
jgi:hypothetical protein